MAAQYLEDGLALVATLGNSGRFTLLLACLESSVWMNTFSGAGLVIFVALMLATPKSTAAISAPAQAAVAKLRRRRFPAQRGPTRNRCWRAEQCDTEKMATATVRIAANLNPLEGRPHERKPRLRFQGLPPVKIFSQSYRTMRRRYRFWL